eukprot:6307165-Prymnesium_polylepis.1
MCVHEAAHGKLKCSKCAHRHSRPQRLRAAYSRRRTPRTQYDTQSGSQYVHHFCDGFKSLSGLSG